MGGKKDNDRFSVKLLTIYAKSSEDQLESVFHILIDLIDNRSFHAWICVSRQTRELSKRPWEKEALFRLVRWTRSCFFVRQDLWFRTGTRGRGRLEQSHDSGGGDAVLPRPRDSNGRPSLYIGRRRLEYRLHLWRTARPPHSLPGSDAHPAGDWSLDLFVN